MRGYFHFTTSSLLVSRRCLLSGMVILLLSPFHLKAQVIMPDSAIVAIEKQLLSTTNDSVKTKLNVELAKQHLFYSYKPPNDAEFRKAEIQKAQAVIRRALKIQKSTEALALEAALMLEEIHFLSDRDAAQAIDTSKKQLDSILKSEPDNTVASLAYATLAPEILKVNWFKRMVAKIFYTALPDDMSNDKALLYLLQVKHQKEYSVYTYFRLAEMYFRLANNRDGVESIKFCLAEPERIGYFDVHWKKEAENLLTIYKSTP
jgi:hypothetical protein